MNTLFLNARLGARAEEKRFRHKFVIEEGHAGLLYRHGVFVRLINAGRHVLWGFGWSANVMDLRKTTVVVPNPALMNLRLMQSLSAAQGAGNTLVLGVPGGFVPLKNVTPSGETPKET